MSRHPLYLLSRSVELYPNSLRLQLGWIRARQYLGRRRPRVAIGAHSRGLPPGFGRTPQPARFSRMGSLLRRLRLAVLTAQGTGLAFGAAWRKTNRWYGR